MPERLPTIFFGHGNPMNAVLDNTYSRGWRAIAQSFRKPSAIAVISGHWYVPGSKVTWNERPRTIHDFGGFPSEMYAIRYPALGDRELADRIITLLAPTAIVPDEQWGLDHGVWAVLRHMYPDADIPVVQISVDETKDPQFHYELGARLRPLRDENVLVVGSGNLVHNLHAFAWGRRPNDPFDWAERFERRARELLLSRTFEPLIDYQSMGEDAMLSVPTPDHYLPLLYVMGASHPDDAVTFPVEGFDGGSASMTTVRFG